MNNNNIINKKGINKRNKNKNKNNFSPLRISGAVYPLYDIYICK
jgi:hypothetical protein